jgi:hypothetical protein
MTRVVIVGEMYNADLSIWGGPGPVQPPSGGPPGIWGGGNVPMPTPPIAPGGPPPWVSHPIPPVVWPNPPGQGPGNPPGFWGGTPPNYIDIGGPGQQPPSGSPPGIWGGANQPFPTPPIFIPPGMPPATPPEGPIDWKTAWSPQTGWIVVGVPNVPVPTPSA